MQWLKKIWDWVKGLVGVSDPAPLVPDLSLINDYSGDLQAKEPYKPPFISHFSKGQKHLYYIAACHEFGADAPTHQTIRHAIDNYKPDLVIIEGVETNGGISPQKIVEDGLKQQQHGQIDERNYAALLATSANIPFLGGEPPDAEVFTHMRQQGYSDKDTMGFYALRMMPFWRKQHGMTEATIDEFVGRYLNDSHFDHIAPQERMTAQEFRQWYDAHKTNNKSLMETETWEFPPLNTPNATYFQRMSHATSIIREKNLDQTIAAALNNHDKVLVVYGSGHLAQSSRVFENMFGNVEHVKIAGHDPGMNYRTDWSKNPRNQPGGLAGVSPQSQCR